MAKIDEITELLTNELNTFKVNVEKLEKLNEKLQATKLKVDIKELRSLLQEHERNMKYNLDSQERIYKRFEGLLKNARIKLSWITITSVGVMLLTIAFLIYNLGLIQKMMM